MTTLAQNPFGRMVAVMPMAVVASLALFVLMQALIAHDFEAPATVGQTRIMCDEPAAGFMQQHRVIELQVLAHSPLATPTFSMAPVIEEAPEIRVEGFLPRVMTSPVYPERALRLGMDGYVVIQFDINTRGLVENPRVIEAKPKRIFNKAALHAIKRFRYVPQKVNGQPVAVQGIVNKFIFGESRHPPSNTDQPPSHGGPTMLAFYTSK